VCGIFCPFFAALRVSIGPQQSGGPSPFRVDQIFATRNDDILVQEGPARMVPRRCRLRLGGQSKSNAPSAMHHFHHFGHHNHDTAEDLAAVAAAPRAISEDMTSCCSTSSGPQVTDEASKSAGLPHLLRRGRRRTALAGCRSTRSKAFGRPGRWVCIPSTLFSSRDLRGSPEAPVEDADEAETETKQPAGKTAAAAQQPGT